MSENRSQPPSEVPHRRHPPGAFWWSVGCVMFAFAENETIQKFGGQWPISVVVLLWALPAIPFAIWFFRREWILRNIPAIRERFWRHPVSYALCCLLFFEVATNAAFNTFARINGENKSEIPPSAPKPADRGQRQTNQPPPPVQADQEPLESRLTKKKPTQNQPKAPTATPPPVSVKGEPLAGQQQPSATVDCNGNVGNCAGVNTGQQIINQFGPPKLEITDGQRDSICGMMKQFAGTEVDLKVSLQTPDSGQYGRQLQSALECAGLKVTSIQAYFLIVTGAPPGVSFSLSDVSNPAAQQLGRAMRIAGVANAPIPAQIVPQAGKAAFSIFVEPTR